MSFLRNLFGRSGKPEDKGGIFLYAICDRCGERLRIRIDRQYDLNRLDDGGYIWHKTLVDGKCYRPMPTVVTFDQNYQVVTSEIEGGHYISREAYEAGADESREEK